MNFTAPRKIFAMSASALVLVLIGCAGSKTVEKNQYSGFLPEYSKLQPVTTESGTPAMRWLSPDLSKGDYDKVLLEKTVLYLGKDQKPSEQVSQETMNQIVGYLTEAQQKVLKSKLALVSSPGPKTLRVRTAITAITTDKGLKPYEVIPVALVFAAASNAAGTRDAQTAIYVEGEITDSQTGALLGEFVRKDMGPELENAKRQLTLKDVQPMLDKWASEFYSTLKKYTKLQ